MKTNPSFQKIALPVILVSAALFIIHVMLVLFVLPPVYALSKFWLIYLFLVPLTLGGLYFIHRASKKTDNSVSKGFFIYMVVKMILVLLFFTPWLIYKDEFSRPIVYQFFLVFFPLLFMETYVLIKLVNLNGTSTVKLDS